MRWLWATAITTAVNAVALWLASLLLPGLQFGGDPSHTLRTVVLVAVVFGVVNAVVKPVATFVSAPVIWLTLGLFRLVVNAVMLEVTSFLANAVGLSFTVEKFLWDAVGGGLVVTIVSLLLAGLHPARRAR